jgi:hypothetical protein
MIEINASTSTITFNVGSHVSVLDCGSEKITFVGDADEAALEFTDRLDDHYLHRIKKAINEFKQAPSQEMVNAGLEALRTDNVRDTSEEGRIRRIYKAMMEKA